MAKNRIIWFILVLIGVILVEEHRIAAAKQGAIADHAKMLQTLTDSNQRHEATLQSQVKLDNIRRQQEMAMAYAQGRAEEHLHRPFDGQFRYLLDHPYVPDERPAPH
jgi:hypothetical protein